MADITISANDLNTPATSASGSVVIKTAGAALTQWDVCYTDTDGTVKPAVATAEASSKATHVALASCDSGAAAKCLVLSSGVQFTTTGLTAETTYVVSAATAGKMAPTADLAGGNYCFTIGTATSTTVMICHPQYCGTV